MLSKPLPFAILLLCAACAGEAPPPQAVATVATPATVATRAHASPQGDPVEGRRVAQRVGCMGCHGKDLAGRELWGQEGKFRVRSANVTEHASHYDDRGFERLLRTGATHSGQRALGMPVQMFQYLSDREVRDITAFVRSMPRVANPGLKPSWFTAAERKKQEAWGDDLGDPLKAGAGAEPPAEGLALGKHIALTSCGECHGYDLNGFEDDPVPPLVVAKAYSAKEFEQLMRTGKRPDGTDTRNPLMSEVARDRFATTLTDVELSALKAFLDAR